MRGEGVAGKINASNLRVGYGYDAHRLAEGRRFVLGGVEIPHEKGLLGHSDADVLAHAVIDALIGAAALGDIGRHFPPTDAAYKGISSIELLGRVAKLLDEKGFMVVNVDSTVVCEAPRLAAHIPGMIKNISGALGIDPGCVNVKAKTEEGMGFTGSGEGMSAHAVALLGVLK